MHNESKTEFTTKIISCYNHEDDYFIDYHDQCSCVSEIEFLHEAIYRFEIFVFSCEQEIVGDAQILTCELEIHHQEQKIPKNHEDWVRS